MGMENWIEIESKESIKVPFWVEVDYFNNITRKNLMVCYWCKHYGFRDMIKNKIFGFKEGKKTRLTMYEVSEIRKILMNIANKKKWEYARSVWEWKEVKKTVYRQIINLYWLEHYMKKHEVFVWLVDSI